MNENNETDKPYGIAFTGLVGSIASKSAFQFVRRYIKFLPLVLALAYIGVDEYRIHRLKSKLESATADNILKKSELATCRATIDDMNNQIDIERRNSENIQNILNDLKPLLDDYVRNSSELLNTIENERTPQSCEESIALMRKYLKSLQGGAQ